VKKIMILSSVYTGHGHKSICEAIVEQLAKYPDVECQVIDGFELIGKAGVSASKMYGPITQNARRLYDWFFQLSNRASYKPMEELFSAMIYQRFIRRLRAFAPDLILTVHPFFNGSVLTLLNRYKLDVPFVALQADIINIHRTWCDPRATLTICPTPEAFETSVKLHGMPPEKMEIIGFPTRARFCDYARQNEHPRYEPGRPLRCLLMSGGEGTGNLKSFAQQLLANLDCTLDIVTGRNAKAKKALEECLLPKYEGRVVIHSFVDAMQELMAKADLLIARGSPNTLMEAVVMNVPILITGSLPGQEADNPAVMTTHNLAALCENPESAPAIIQALLADGGKRLNEISRAQREYRNLDNAKHIAERIYGMAEPGRVSYARIARRMPSPSIREAMEKFKAWAGSKN
jgi:UDP-N-acetylglucosamine:LPS N-acetylglucosamine transferase